MAWNYARFVNKVVEEGKAEYNIPDVRERLAAAAEPCLARQLIRAAGRCPRCTISGGPERPRSDVLAPDLYLEYFDEVCERFTRNGNPLFIPETSANAANVHVRPSASTTPLRSRRSAIERSVGPDTELAAAYRVISQLAPAIAAQQGKGTMTAVRMNQGDAPLNVKLGDYTLNLTYIGTGRVPIAPQPAARGWPAAPAGGRAARSATGRKRRLS